MDSLPEEAPPRKRAVYDGPFLRPNLMNPFRRTIPLLAFCQALMMSSMSLIVATSVLVGYALATDKSLAALPLAAQFIATMLTTIPASLLMDRIGRKAGFLGATLFGIGGGIVTALAIWQGTFSGFVMGSVLIGIFTGFANYYRFAAADAVDTLQKGRAISYVLAGGVIAAFIGPNLATITKGLVANAPFAGSYAALVILYLLSFITLWFVRFGQHEVQDQELNAQISRPLRTIALQPKFVVAVLCGMLGYGVMSFVMTATPLAMQHHAHAFQDTSFVIQWHVLGMFAPSFFTGHLIHRFGLLPILLSGALLGIACVTINLLGNSVTHFWVALLTLGVSWNFLFIGATTLLTETYHPWEKGKSQALNDFIVFSTVAAASLSAGAVQHRFGWQAVNLGAIPLLLLILSSILWLKFASATESLEAERSDLERGGEF